MSRIDWSADGNGIRQTVYLSEGEGTLGQFLEIKLTAESVIINLFNDGEIVATERATYEEIADGFSNRP